MKHGLIAMACSIVVIAGCAGVRVSQDYDPATDFNSLNTYRWAADNQAKTGDPRLDSPFRDARIRESVEGVLAQKGFVRSADTSPSVVVSYKNLLRQKIESRGTSSGIGFGVGSYGRRGGIAVSTGNNIREYDEVTLIIDFVDGATDALLWRGTGVQRFQAYDNPQKTSQDINTLVEAILKQFPPQT
jgi:hypothetical protein